MSKYPLCPYCEDSCDEQGCKSCISNYEYKIKRKEDFMKEMAGKTCCYCKKVITREEMEAGNDVGLSSSTSFDKGVSNERAEKYYHIKCRGY